ncbi:MAG: SusD/RagB family nutrient-binding outer membrane lipoprotein [Marinilabiliaceae bacterium]|nr:SusD/RagB family nutrient-binding outer membrane lipoprotein [Marinilabiliaceae bacterium]
MKNNIIILFLVMFVFSFSSCTDDFEEMNTNPSAIVVNTNPALYMSELFFRGYTYGDLQTSTNLHHDLYSQYLSNVQSGFNTTPFYIANDSWLSNRWLRYYTIYYKLHLKILETEELSDVNSNAANYSRIYFAWMSANMTDTYGDMPFLTASIGENNQKFDKQETIFSEIFNLLTEAEANLVVRDDKFNPGDYDIIYGDEGDEAPNYWKRFANSLRLRYAMKMVNASPAKARTEAEAAMAKALILDNSQNALLSTDYERAGWGSYGNQRWMIENWGRGAHFVMSKSMEKYFQTEATIADPRQSILFYNVENNPGVWTGKRNGENSFPSVADNYSTLSTDYFTSDKRYELFEAAETYFLLAEAKLRGWNLGENDATVQELYEKGIRASMEFVGVSTDDANAYVAALNGLDVFAGTDREAILEKIINQKWVALFPSGPDGWAEFRRTDYPALYNIVDPDETYVKKNLFIKRCKYPNNEYDANGANMPYESVTAERLDDKVWWDVEDTNNADGTRKQPNNFR